MTTAADAAEPGVNRVVELTMPTLGLRPFVLLEFNGGGEGGGDLRCTIQVGGGMSLAEHDHAIAIAIALAELPGNPYLAELAEHAEEYPEHAEAVAAIRQRFGWAL